MGGIEVIETIKIENITPYEWNPRNNEAAVQKVAASIKEFGFKVPIVLDKNGVIIAGHTRYAAAKTLGLSEVPCVIAKDLSDAQARAFRLADNKVAELAQWDFNALGLELAEIELDMQQFGFEDETITADAFSDEFTLPEGDKPNVNTMTFTLAKEQKSLIEYAMALAGEGSETYGNTDKKGNSLFEVVRQWAELKK